MVYFLFEDNKTVCDWLNNIEILVIYTPKIKYFHSLLSTIQHVTISMEKQVYALQRPY